jgi:hypothetical protein
MNAMIRIISDEAISSIIEDFREEVPHRPRRTIPH